MALTIEECQAALDCARAYPPNNGRFFIVPDATDVELQAAFPQFLPTRNLFADADSTVTWLKLHPEDLAKACPAVVVAAMRGHLNYHRVWFTLLDIGTELYEGGWIEFCAALNTPAKVVQRLEELLARLEQEKHATDNCRVSSCNRPSEEIPVE
jgi:hypothetical protein